MAAVRASVAHLSGLALMQSVPMPTPILLIAREPLVAGREDAYREIEEETARLSAKLQCPHPYLAMESLRAAPGHNVHANDPGLDRTP